MISAPFPAFSFAARFRANCYLPAAERGNVPDSGPEPFIPMPDLIHLAIPAFLLLMVVEAVIEREIYEAKDAAATITMGNKLRYVFGNPGWRHEPGTGPTFGSRQPT